jgi:hypothetical protein
MQIDVGRVQQQVSYMCITMPFVMQGQALPPWSIPRTETAAKAKLLKEVGVSHM